MLVLGASGSGKSTLLRGIAGLLGDETDGQSLGSIALGDDETGEGPSVGLVLQDPDSQVMFARVGDDVAFGCENLGVAPAEIPGRVRAALRTVSLDLPLDHPTDTLSGGQKQRLALAGVLAMQPDILLLDEPTAMLDADGIASLRAAVTASVQNRSRTLVIVEHRIDVWCDVVDRVVVLGRSGELVCDGPPDTVFRDCAEVLDELGIWMPQHASASVAGQRAGVQRHDSESHEASAETPMLSTHELRVGWAEESSIPIADLSLRAGTVTAIVGSNGVGKSTLALTLGGLLGPHAGEVRLNTAEAPGSLRSAELPTRIASVFQTPEHQFVRASVREELALGLGQRVGGGALQDAELNEFASRFALGTLLDANPYTLSGGEQRRLSVAAAIAANPSVLILDEPTFGQDAHTWRALVHALTELRASGCTIIVVTHDESLVTALADDVISLRQSQHRTSASVTIQNEHRAARDRRRGILSVNPLAKISAAAVITIALVLTLDWFSATVALTLELLLLPWLGIPLRKLVRMLAPIALAAIFAGFSVALYGQRGGAALFDFGLLHISERSIELGMATTLRILAMAIPAVVLLVPSDPVDVADALEQRTRLSTRFVIGALIALRMLNLLSDDWEQLSRARRARGMGDASPITRFARQAFALFVLSLRRADTLATAMQARGFGGSRMRTWSRVSSWGAVDVAVIAIGCSVAAIAIIAAIAAGTWNFAFGGAG